MGQSLSPDLPAGISLERAQLRASNAAMITPRFHGKCSGRCLTDDYALDCDSVLGRGRNSAVVCAHGRINERRCAVKMFQAWAMSAESHRFMVSEVETLLSLDHPNIVQVYDVYDDPNDNVFMVMEYCSGGELYDELKKGRFSEQKCAEAAVQMLSALSYLHSRGVCHRDLKLENLLYSDTSRKTLKLIDFGFASVYDGKHKLEEACGTADYVSPEVLVGDGHTTQCDMWSLGVLVFMLLAGRAPLWAEKREMLPAKIKRGEVDWAQLTNNCDVSPEAMDFLRSLLVIDPESRMTAEMAMLHPWLVKKQAVSKKCLKIGPSICQTLKQYALSEPLRRAVLQLLAHLLSEEEVNLLADLFQSLSTSGSICLEKLQDSPQPELRLLAMLDVNLEGQVYYSGFLAATMNAASLREEVLRDAFARLDVAGTGSIGSEGLREAFSDTFEGLDSEALLAGAARYGVGPEERVDLEAFKRIVLGTESGGSPAPPDATCGGGGAFPPPKPTKWTPPSRYSCFPKLLGEARRPQPAPLASCVH